MAGDEGPNGDEIDLKQVPEGWRWVIVQVVRWWGYCAVWRFFFFFFFGDFTCDIFVYFKFPFLSCCGEMFLTLRGPVAVLPGLWSSCSPFPVELTARSFLLPSTSLLFYHSTDTVFPLDSVSFAFPAQLRPPWVESLYLTTLGLPQPVLWVLQVTPWIRLNG